MTRRQAAARTLALPALAALVIAGCGGSSAGTGKSERLTMTLTSCGKSWQIPADGNGNFAVTNRFYQPMDVYLASAGGAVYEELEGLGTGATVKFNTVLGSGRYQFQCYPDDEAPTEGPVVDVHSTATRAATTPGVQPVTEPELVKPTIAYQNWVIGRLPALLAQVDALAGDVRGGATAQAKAAWLKAHLTYETLGAAYDAFGPLDDKINGFPTDGQSALHDKDLSGFHKIEALLWAGAPAAQLTPAVATLKHAVQLLIKQFATTEIDPNILALRAHEIVENAVQFELTGRTDAGSHTNIATIGANLYGSAKTLSLVAPILRTRYPALKQTEQALASTRRYVATFDHDGRWAALQTLPLRKRQQLDADMENLVELLAPIASICDVRQVPNQT